MITDKLKELVATYIQGTAFNNARIGQGGNSTSPAATTLDVQIGTTTSIFSAIKSDDNVVEVQAVFQGSSSDMTGKVIREFGILDSSNNLLARVNFDGVGPFSSNENLEVFFLLEVE
tara:strand:+ start:327 stop:677 length:351 start_codon:yes stop_codon:yes gene_type:complete